MGSSIRITGMASGLDTDSIVEQLMNVEKQSYYKAQRQQYKTEYQMEAYREVITKLTDFSNKYLDTLSSTNMKSSAFFRKFKTTATSSITGQNSNAVTITSTADGNAGSHTVEIKQVAQKASISGTKTSGVVKTAAITPDTETGKITYAEGSTIEVTIDGKTKKVSIEGEFDSLESLAETLTERIKTEFGTGYDGTNGKVLVEAQGERLNFITQNGASSLTVYAGEDPQMVFTNNSSSISLSSSIESLKNSFTDELTFSNAGDDDDTNDQIKFKINGKEFQFDKSQTLKEIMNEINNDEDIKANIEFNSTTGRFTIESDSTGGDEYLEIEDLDGSNFFQAIGIAGADGKAGTTESYRASNKAGAEMQIGQDTLAKVDGVEIARSTRNFTLDGITYQANEVTAEGEKININFDVDTDAVFDSIKDFVKDYNELYDYIQGKLDEEYDRDYQPLTDDERSEMTDDEIEKWDKKAKTGLLHNDSTLRSLLNNLRSQFSGTVTGMQTTFSDIGIKTGTYTNGGKIILDDEGASKLKAAIANNLDDVVALFTQRSTTYNASSSRSYTYDQKAQRKQEEGLMNRFYDTLEDYISTYRDTNNSKGLLLEKAGKVGDTTETTSTLAKQLINYTKKVAELLDKVNSKYDKYYKQFSQLETAMNSLNSQSSYISQLLGQSS